MQKNKLKVLLAPMIALFIFVMLVFGAAYSYYTSTITMNSSNYQVNLPKTTSLICTKTDCSTTVTPAQMLNTVYNASTPKATSSCYVNCTCSGTQGAVCSYDVVLAPNSDFYAPSANLGTNKELTVTVTSPSGCTARNSSGTETQLQLQGGQPVSRCTLTVPSGGSVSANVAATFKWYNQNLDQSTHANRAYNYQLKTYADSSIYQRVDSILFAGAQYVDTGFAFNPTTDGYQVWFKPTAASQDAMVVAMGSRTNRVWTYHASAVVYVTTSVGSGTSHAGDTSAIHMSAYNNRKLYYDGTLEKDVAAFSTLDTYPDLFIGALINGSEKGWYYKGYIYALAIYRNNSLAMYLVPVYRKSDSKPGYYDTIGGGFYTNSGTGADLTAGSNI